MHTNKTSRFNRKNAIVSVTVFGLITVALISIARAYDIQITGSDDPVLVVQSTRTGVNATDYAVYGYSVQNPGYGYGGYFQGGKAGLYGISNTSGAGDRVGGQFGATNGSNYNYGVYSTANGGTYARGGHFYANGASSNNYGIYAYGSTYAGYFSGSIYTTGSYLPSDEKLKTDISDTENSLERIMELKPINFRYRTEKYAEMNLPEGYYDGLLAQDVEQVFPEIVREVSISDDEKVGTDSVNKTRAKGETALAVNYVQLIPVLIGAIQEQQQQIAKLQAQIAKCR
jgi:hypothetical protein